jgi:hypothetical protein
VSLDAAVFVLVLAGIGFFALLFAVLWWIMGSEVRS